MPRHTISVTVGNDTIRVVPETLTMTALDEVRWAGVGPRKFSLVFDSDRAFGRRELHHEAASVHQRPATTGRFKYTVVSGDDPKVVLDPVIIVEDPPTGPHP